MILDDLQESTTWRLWAQNRKHTNQACTRPREEGPPQRDSYIPGEPAAGVDLQCTPTFTEPNEIYQGNLTTVLSRTHTGTRTHIRTCVCEYVTFDSMISI